MKTRKVDILLYAEPGTGKDHKDRMESFFKIDMLDRFMKELKKRGKMKIKIETQPR